MKEKVKKLIELIEHNRTTLWNENLEGTSDCIILENVHSKEICLEPHSSDDCEEYNHQFTGGEIEKLIEEIKKNYKSIKFKDMEKEITITENNGRPHLIFIDKQPSEIKAKKLYNKNGYYISTQMGFYGVITSYWKNTKTLKDYTSKKYHNQINEQI